MKKSVVTVLFAFWVAAAWADDSSYVLRVDGLACPYCAYGVEKKLKRIDGVTSIDVDLENGLVTVQVKEGISLDEAETRTLLNDAGFTFRSMTRKVN